MSGQSPLDEAGLPEYLRRLGVLRHSEGCRVEPAGDGNINWVRRVLPGGGSPSLVVKQARPALEAFPQYRVSTERILFEARYGREAAPFDEGPVCPRVMRFDPEQRVLVMEDLTGAERLDAALARGAAVAPACATLASFLGRVHAGTRDPALAERFANDEMRRLHGDHVFFLPYPENDFPLSPAVARGARAIAADRELVAIIDAAYSRYLEPRGALLHGDVQPTNVLLAERGPVLLDAEIAHVGDPAFDVGLPAGHLWLAAIARDRPAESARPAVRAFWSAYAEAHGPDGLVRFADAARHGGIEMLRRTIGAARVPAVERDEVALAVLEAGVALVKSPPLNP